jgi:hypothetical protein
MSWAASAESVWVLPEPGTAEMPSLPPAYLRISDWEARGVNGEDIGEVSGPSAGSHTGAVGVGRLLQHAMKHLKHGAALLEPVFARAADREHNLHSAAMQ